MKNTLSIIATIASLLLAFAGQNEFLLQLAGVPADQMKLWMTLCFIAGMLYPGIVLPVELWRLRNTVERRKKCTDSLLRDSKAQFLLPFSMLLSAQPEDFNIRIFFPVRGSDKWFQRLLGKRLFKTRKNNILENDNLPDGLCFRVHPQPQGVMGKAFTEKEKALLDFDVKNNPDMYHLGSYQKQKTADVEFVAAVAICNQADRVLAILSIDSVKRMTVKNEEQLGRMVKKFGAIIENYLPLMD